MAIRISTTDPPLDGIAGLILEGAVGRSDHEHFNREANALREQGHVRFLLDLSRLGSISAELAVAIHGLESELADRGGRLAIHGANVVVRWYLHQHFGERIGLVHSDRDSALQVLAVDQPVTPEEIARDVPSSANEIWQAPAAPIQAAHKGARPDRFSHSTLELLLDNGGDLPQTLTGVENVLRRSGLAAGCRLVCGVGGVLSVVGRPELKLDAHGWLGSLLAGAGCPMSLSEIGSDGLTSMESAFLDWSAADIFVPLIAEGDLIGVLCIISERPAGLWGYRTGEVLAFSMLARRLRSRILADHPRSAPGFAEDDESEFSDQEIDFLLDSPETTSI